MSQSSFQGFLSPRPDKKGGGSNFKSVQSGTTTWSSTTTTLDVTIASIDPTKSIAKIGLYIDGYNAENAAISIKILNSTTLRLTRITGSDLGATIIQYEVTEYYNVKSLQTGTLVLANVATEQVVTTSNYNYQKSYLYASSTSNAVSAAQGNFALGYRMRSNSDIVFLGKIGTTAYYQLIEFY